MLRCLTRERQLLKQCYVSLHTTFSRMISIQATPQLSLVDEKVQVNLSGLEPGSKVTLRSQLDEMKMRFEAHAHYQADDKGEVSLTENSSSGGSYTGIEPMGMFWSMQPSPGQRPGLRYSKKDVTTPMDITLSVYKDHINVETLDSMEPIAKTLVQKTYMGPNVERQKVHHGRIRGMVYKPKGPGPFPGIIDMFGTAGGILEFRSALLASRGFVSYSLPFFAFEDLPQTLENIQLEYFEEAIDWLLSQSYVLPGGVGTVGVSTGGELSLMLATYFPEKVKAAVFINGATAHMTPGLCYKGVDFPIYDVEMSKFHLYPDNTLQGIDLFTEPKTWDDNVFIKVEKAKGQILYMVGEDDLNWPTPKMVEQSVARLKAHGKDNYQVLSYPKAGHLIEPPYAPVERAKGEILYIVGEGDLNSPSLGMVEESIARLKTHGKDNYQVWSYPKTGHLIEPPYAPVCTKSYHKVWGYVMRWGGCLKEHADAQEDSWPKMLQFLYKHVGGTSYTHTVTTSKL